MSTSNLRGLLQEVSGGKQHYERDNSRSDASHSICTVQAGHTRALSRPIESATSLDFFLHLYWVHELNPATRS